VRFSEAQDVDGALVYSKNVTVDSRLTTVDPSYPYTPHDILANKYTTDTLGSGYQIWIRGVATIQNLSSHDGTLDLLVVNSSPLCGSPYGLPPFGLGRVVTVTVPGLQTITVPISFVTWAAPGITSTAHLQYRHNSPWLTVKKNSSLDVITLPSSSASVTVSPTGGLPLRPDNCP